MQGFGEKSGDARHEVAKQVARVAAVGEPARAGAGFPTMQAATLFCGGANVRGIEALLISQRGTLDFTPRKA